MIDVSKKNEKFMVNRNKEKLKAQNESRGESPARKGSFPPKNNSSGTTLANNSTMTANASNPATPSTNNTNKKLSQLSRNASMVPLSNTTINISINDINANNTLRKLERASSGCMKNQLQQMVNIQNYFIC